MGNKKVIMPLLGGLGNQLFQLSAALCVADDREVLLISNLGNQRRNVENLPEIQSLELSENVKLDTKMREHVFCTVIFNRLLMSKRDSLLSRILLRPIAKIVLSIHFCETVRIHTSNNVGFDEWKQCSSTEVGIGYFQSYLWTEKPGILELMQNLRPKHESDRFIELRKQIRESESLVIHIRLGDYLNEPGIGALGFEYYVEALKEFSSHVEKYWIFSDQPQEAQKLLPEAILAKCLFVQPSELNTIETWELMRYGGNYIISNSTYSWWSARLSYTENPIVIVPKPWFKALPDPKSIIPHQWKEISR